MKLSSTKYLLTLIFIFSYLNVIFAQKNDTIYLDPKEDLTVRDTIKIDTVTVKRPKGKLEDFLYYDSKDQISKLKEKKSYLIDDAVVKYTDIELTADYIEIDWNTEIISAQCKRDSLGKCKNKTIFKQGNQSMQYETFQYNIKTGVGVATNVRIEDGIPDGIMVAEKVKKINDSVLYSAGIFYTPDPEFTGGKTDEPDFYIVANKAKFKKEKIVVTSPAQAYIHGVPTPLILPWGIFPIGGEKSRAGIIVPSFGENSNQGFYLENMGFYIPFGDYIDLKTTLDVYTKGSWGVHLLSNYKKRYKFNGGFGFDYEVRKQGTKGLSSYSEQQLIRLNWRHAQDAKSNPNLRLSANVNYASTNYFNTTLNSGNYISGNNLTNTISSSVSLSKTFDNLPITVSLSATHSQNSQTNQVNMTLPRFNLIVDRQYPFAPKVGSKKGLLQNIGIDYSFDFENKVQVMDDNLFKKEMWDSLQNGFQHQISANTGVTLAKYFNFNLSGTYKDVWYLETINRAYNPKTNSVEDTTVNGFKTYRTFNFSSSLSTNLYKTLHFDKKNKDAWLKAVRHVMTPSISYSFTPDFSTPSWGYYETYRDGSGNLNIYSPFEDGIYGAPGRGLSSSVGLSLRHNLEAKIRDNKNDSLDYKKIKLFDYVNMSTSYNMAADSLQWSDLTVSGSTKFFNDRISVNFNATWDPYDFAPNYADDGSISSYKTIDKLGPRLVNWGVSTGYTFNNDTFKRNSDKKNSKNKESSDNPYRGAVRYDVYEYDKDGYARFKIPWSLGLNFSHRTTRQFLESSHATSVNINGSIEPAPYWKIGYNTSYDFTSGKFAALRLNLTRDLRSFNMTFGWVPTGTYQTWNLFIGLKASMLQDVKYEDDNPLILNQSSGGF
ncbi:MAG: putative LPS assembly protein LptD [Flavobacteriales bacterium]